MIGLVNYSSEPLSVELRELRRPEVGDADVLLEVGAVAVCGSDVHQWMSKHSWPVNYPVVLGHEFGGTVVEVGRGAAGFSPGDRVVSETAAVINPQSPLTRRGLYNLDPDRKGFGYGVDGAMAQFVRVPARCLHRIPEHLPFEQAALTEPCCVAYNAVISNSDIKAGDRLAVIGPGPIGLLCAVVAQLAGADVALVGLERDRGRLRVAERYGLTTIEGDVSDWAFQADGLGVHGVVDAAGVSQTLKTALQIVRPAGWITKVGWGREPLGFSLDPLVQKNITLRGSFSHTWEIWEAVIGLLTSGQLNVEPIIGGIWPLEEWETGFEQMHSGQILKAVLHP
jgi:alcohol dehydrogenase/L-iditol 2-dehydrogenase